MLLTVRRPGPHASPHRRATGVPRPVFHVVLVTLLAVGLAPWSSGTPHADARPLPDARAFSAEVRKRLLDDDRTVESHYTYLEHRQEISVSKLGGVSNGPVKVYQVYPSAEPGNTYKRLIAIDGVPLSQAELDRQDRKHREDLAREAEKRRRETPDQRAARRRDEAKDRKEYKDIVFDLFNGYSITLVGRDRIDGHDVIVAALEPRPEYQPRTDEGKVMQKLRARAWVSESDYEVVRVEGEAIEDITYGWGIAGRLHKGSRGVFERRKINDEVWLPARIVLEATGRALLFRTFSLHTVTTYSDYRRFDVATEESFRTSRAETGQ